jgi:ABC-type thiamine transport system ATPase subunit
VKRIVLAELGGREIIRADLELDAGVHTVVVMTPEGGNELVELASGLRAPRRGTVLVDGKNPYTRPEVRGKIGSLFAVENVSEVATVAAWVARALLLKQSTAVPSTVLEAVGLSALAKRTPGSLSIGEARGVALAVALATEGGAILLFEPLATAAGRARVVASVANVAEKGAAVVCVTASARDAGDIGGNCFPLRFGRLGGDTSVRALAASAESVVEMVVRTDDPRRLCSALSMDPVFSHVRSDFVATPGEVVVRGDDSDRVALGILRGARQSGAKVLALWQRGSFRKGAGIGGHP